MRKNKDDSTFAERAINFYFNLSNPPNLPNGIGVMNPYKNKSVKNIIKEFFEKFFPDNNKRILAMGINPGRFGGGITGIPFTDPVALNNYCGIKNKFDKKAEFSSKFVYSFIEKYGGVKKFYSKYFISALYPLALIMDGKNYNYYDDKNLFRLLKPEIISSIEAHLNLGVKNDFVICLGRKNFNYLNEINIEKKFFGKIIVLDHPRYIMQYKSKSVDKYFDQYLSVFK